MSPAARRVTSVLLSFLKVFGTFTLVSVLFALEYYIFYAREGTADRPFFFFLLGALSMAYSWAIVTPVILKATEHWGFERGRRRRVLYYHLMLLMVLAPIRALLDMGLMSILLSLYHDERLELLFSDNYRSFFAGLPTAPVYYFLIAGIGYTASYYRKYRERELAASELERALAQSHLETLKGQLNPHFLFNTLNAIGALSRNDPDATKRMVTLLGGLLRRSLGRPNEPQEVPLRQELDFVRHYLEIEKILYSDRLRVEYEIPARLLDATVPNFLLQPIVENAIQHGIAARSGPGTVTLSAHALAQTLELSVSDDGVGLKEGSAFTEGRGLGLTRERVLGLYGNEATLEIENRKGGGATVTLRLPLRFGASGTMGEETP